MALGEAVSRVQKVSLGLCSLSCTPSCHWMVTDVAPSHPRLAWFSGLSSPGASHLPLPLAPITSSHEGLGAGVPEGRGDERQAEIIGIFYLGQGSASSRVDESMLRWQREEACRFKKKKKRSFRSQVQVQGTFQIIILSDSEGLFAFLFLIYFLSNKTVCF